MEPDSPKVPKRTLTQILFVVFLRLVAVTCLWFGLQYWAMLVGYSLGGRARFDLLSLPWQVAAPSLAVLFPIASLGLWLTVSWGPVLFALAAVTQVLMFKLWSDMFGTNSFVLLFHALVASLYVLFRIALWLEERRRAEQVTGDLP
nr:transmembrane protein [Rhizobium sp. Q54]